MHGQYTTYPFESIFKDNSAKTAGYTIKQKNK